MRGLRGRQASGRDNGGRGIMGKKRFDIFFEKHIGLGIRWDRFLYAFDLSISIMCITITIGFGEEK